MRALLAAALLAACASEPGAGRDYTLTACPTPQLGGVSGPSVCDRGIGFSPRFVSFNACETEAGLPLDSTQRCSHPNRDPCPGSQYRFFCTYESIAQALR